MAEIRDSLAEIEKPFAVEIKIGCTNQSVFGGFDNYVINACERALQDFPQEESRGKLENLKTLFAGYREMPPNQRRKLIYNASRIFSQLKGEVLKPAVEAKKKIAESAHSKFIPPLDSEVKYAKGVGPIVAKKLERLRIKTIEDLLFHMPRRYDDRSRIKQIYQLEDGSFETINGITGRAAQMKPRYGLTITKIPVNDGSGVAFLTWFNQPYMKSTLKPGTKVIASGKVEIRYREIQIHNPEFEVISEEEDTINTGRIVPVYPLTENLSQRYLRKIIKSALDNYSERLVDAFPIFLRERNNLLDFSSAINQAHFPDDFKALSEARKRLIFEELFFLQLRILMKKQKTESVQRSTRYKLDTSIVRKFEEILPFELTEAQKKVIDEILKNMESETPMNRLLQGDVGSGKTAVAAFAALCAVKSGYQAAVMAPTEILAGQHSVSFLRLVSPFDVNVESLIGSMSRREKDEVLSRIECGDVDLVVGTHALIQENVNFKNLGLVIIDEQHKFGVLQRAYLKDKGLNPDMLVMTATPIPRTLALTLYGDLDISVIDEMPAGRKKIKSFWVSQNAREGIFQFIRQEVKKGNQAYIVCPLIEESEKLDLKSAVEEAEVLKTEVFPDLRVGLLHGRMRSDEKEEVMEAFRKKEFSILISTTVIEVGVDVPDATVMVVLNADRFGLAQLHQLRGRVGRSSKQSYGIFVADPYGEEGRERMQAISSVEDGFALAEQDLKIRGPGDYYGTRQHGIPELKIADIVRDVGLMEKARNEANLILEKDPELETTENKQLKKRLQEKFHDLVDLIH